jgi:hypothetical protein
MASKEELEKEAEERITEQYGTSGEYITRQRIWQDGAEFGYNKANEWHYVKDGDLPKDTTSLYLVRVYSWDFGLSHLYKKYGMYIPIVCEWKGEYFSALDEMAYSNARNIKNCIAWKEIVFLKEIE